MKLDNDRIKEIIEQASIPENQKRVIFMRLGLGEEAPMGLNDIAKILKLRGKKLTDLIDKCDRLAYNLLKSEQLNEIVKD